MPYEVNRWEYIKSQNNKGKIYFNISACDWISYYQFNYTDIDLPTPNKIISMFSLNHLKTREHI